ncbi:uncharacterized protein LOC117505894 [Thalassophryne amazonica]|uniref:uncharacterized protein LOC117505894 n=1 Tax=Thalassophryne amazonica TaxID=390379 RepID=UPI001470F63C|nr:uncharacterized protein LOC117505894 [Thalassophryne amazonica]
MASTKSVPALLVLLEVSSWTTAEDLTETSSIDGEDESDRSISEQLALDNSKLGVGVLGTDYRPNATVQVQLGILLSRQYGVGMCSLFERAAAGGSHVTTEHRLNDSKITHRAAASPGLVTRTLTALSRPTAQVPTGGRATVSVKKAARVHDGIIPAAQASVHEFSRSVGPRAVPRQFSGAADLQHQRVEQCPVSCDQSVPGQRPADQRAVHPEREHQVAPKKQKWALLSRTISRYVMFLSSRNQQVGICCSETSGDADVHFLSRNTEIHHSLLDRPV